MNKKLLFAVMMLFSVIAVSCSSSKNASSDSSTELKKKMFNGTWVVSSVDEDPGLAIAPDLTVLGIGDPSCFNQSTWALVSNNNKGTITLPESSLCYASAYSIVWSVKGDTFAFKIIDGDIKAKEVTAGYEFKILSIDEQSMSLQTTVRFLNKDCPIIFNLNKQ